MTHNGSELTLFELWPFELNSRRHVDHSISRLYDVNACLYFPNLSIGCQVTDRWLNVLGSGLDYQVNDLVRIPNVIWFSMTCLKPQFFSIQMYVSRAYDGYIAPIGKKRA